MSNIELKNVEGGAAGTVELSSDVFGIEPNIPVMHQVVVAYEACLRQGTHSTKNRHFVSGGGVIFGPLPHSHALRANNKMKKLAMRSALSSKLADGELIVVDQLSFEKPSTKQAVAILKALGIADKRVTLVVPDDDVNTYLAFRNIAKVAVIGCSEANTRNILDNGALLMSAEVAKHLEEVLA